MSTLVVNDDVQIDGYAPDVRYVEDVTYGDLILGAMRIGDLTVIPWMSESGNRHFLAGVKIRHMRMAERDRAYFAKRDGMLLSFGRSV